MSEVLLSIPQVIESFGLNAKKSLGQHFLTDTNLLAKVVRAAGELKGKTVVEIGPGPGGLTRAILDSEADQLIAIEKDARCTEALASLKTLYGERFQLLQADAMKVNIATLGGSPRLVIANLPYNVGTALVVDWLQLAAQQGREALESFTVMLQKEVAERLVAQPGSKAYGRLSVIMRQFTDAHIQFDIPPGAFSPPPKVMSSVIRAEILAKPREEVELKKLEQVVAFAFNQRRKMLRQALKPVGGEALCEKAGIDPTLRAENCSLEMFARLARAVA